MNLKLSHLDNLDSESWQYSESTIIASLYWSKRLWSAGVWLVFEILSIYSFRATYGPDVLPFSSHPKMPRDISRSWSVYQATLSTINHRNSILRPETNSLTHHAQCPTLHRWHEKLLYCSKTWIQSPVLSGWRRSVNGYVWSHSGRTSAHWHNLRLLRVHMSLIHPSFYLLLAYTQQDSLPMLLILTIFSTGSDKFSVIELPLARSIGLLLSCYYLCHFFFERTFFRLFHPFGIIPTSLKIS